MRNFIKDLRRKLVKRFKGRNKNKAEVNLPELETYCGCCKLSTGIFIRSIITLVVTILLLVLYITLLTNLFQIKPIIQGDKILIVDKLFKVNKTYNVSEMKELRHIFIFIVSFHCTWIAYKTVYVIILLWTLPAVLQRRTNMVKVLMYASISNWIMDILLTILCITMLENSILARIPIFLSILNEGYNLLAITSEYKSITGKLKPRHKDIEGISGNQGSSLFLSQFVNTSQGDVRYRSPHCGSCRCFEPIMTRRLVTTPMSPESMQSDTAPFINKQIDEFELNYALTGILNMTNVQNDTSRRPVRPNTLDLKIETPDEKVVLTDEPVIYDEGQLNVGTSPVIKDKDF